METIKEQLAGTQRRQQELVVKLRALEQQRQVLMQEALRIEGEVRLLLRLDSNGNKSKEAQQ